MDFSLLVLALGLSMDAATVSIGIGCSSANIKRKKEWLIAFSFGLFQALMPLLGALLGEMIYSHIAPFISYLMFGIFAFLGGHMIYESVAHKDECSLYSNLSFQFIMTLSIATSIDAMAAGFVLPAFAQSIYVSSFWIGLITFLVCKLAFSIGRRFGCAYKEKAEIFGGILLIVLAIKSLL